MRGDGVEWTVIAPLDLLAVSERPPARQFVNHVQGGHTEENGDEKDCRNKK
jgi:hypothetical protein